jgi:hypothetical protein
MLKISDVAAVNPKHVIAVIFDKSTLTTKVVLPGMASLPSDKSFSETVELLNLEEGLSS